MRSLTALATLILFLAGCGSLSVERLEPTAKTDLSGAWNDTDSRQMATSLLEDLQSTDPLRGAESDATIIVGALKNQGSAFISTTSIERAIDAGMTEMEAFRVVSSPEMREQLRTERTSQEVWAREDTRSELQSELGADYMLYGTLHTWEERDGRVTVRTYRVDAYLASIATTEQVWAGSHEIKKQIEAPVF